MSSKNKGKNKNKGGNKGGNKPANDDVPQVNQPQTEKKESPTLPEIADNVQNEFKTEKEETPTVHDQNSNTDVSRNQELSQTALDHPEDTKLQTVEVTGQSKESEHAEIPPKQTEPLQVQTEVETTAFHEEPTKKTEEPERHAQDRHQQVLQNVESLNKELQNYEIKEETKQQEPEPERAIPEPRDSTEFQIISSGDFTKVENVQNLPIVEEENTNAANKNETVEQVQATHSEPVQQREDKAETSQNEQNPYLSTEILVEHKQNVPVETLQQEVVDNRQQTLPETAPKVEEFAPQVIEQTTQDVNHGNEQKREEYRQENPIENEVHVDPPRQEEPRIQQQTNQNTQNSLHQQQTSKVQPLSQTQNKVEVSPSSEEVIDLNRPMDQEPSTKKKKEETIFRLVESNEISVNESNQISVDGSLQIKRSDEVKEVPVKESLSFSDLNYSIERSASASQEQERVPLINPLGSVEQIVRQQNINESILSDNAPLLAEAPQAVFVSQPVEILVDNESLPNASAPSEQFYSIIPEQPAGMVLQTETVVVEHQIIISENGVVRENERVIDRKVEQEIIELNPQQGKQQLQTIPISIEPIIVEQVQSVPVVVPIEQNIKQEAPENSREIAVEAQPERPAVEVVPEPVVEAVPEESVEKVAAAVPAYEPEVANENAVPEVPLAAVEEEKKDLSERMQPSESASPEPQKEEKQIDPVEIKPEKSVLKKLVISTAIGGVAGGAFYLFKSNKTGSLLLGLASLAASYFAV